jgi:hypothetical protein
MQDDDEFLMFASPGRVPFPMYVQARAVHSNWGIVERHLVPGETRTGGKVKAGEPFEESFESSALHTSKR